VFQVHKCIVNINSDAKNNNDNNNNNNWKWRLTANAEQSCRYTYYVTKQYNLNNRTKYREKHREMVLS